MVISDVNLCNMGFVHICKIFSGKSILNSQNRKNDMYIVSSEKCSDNFGYFKCVSKGEKI